MRVGMLAMGGDSELSPKVSRYRPFRRREAKPAGRCRVCADAPDQRAIGVADKSTRSLERLHAEQSADCSPRSQWNFHHLHQFAFFVSVKITFFERCSIRRQRLI